MSIHDIFINLLYYILICVEFWCDDSIPYDSITRELVKSCMIIFLFLSIFIEIFYLDNFLFVFLLII